MNARAVMKDLPTYCPGTWPIDYFDRGQITRGEVACIRPRDHVGLCAARDPESGRQFQFPGLTTREKRP